MHVGSLYFRGFSVYGPLHLLNLWIEVTTVLPRGIPGDYRTGRLFESHTSTQWLSHTLRLSRSRRRGMLLLRWLR